MKLLREKPYVFEVHSEYAHRVCWHCLRFEESDNENISLQRCGRCRFARYCNATCQKGHYKDHKLQCHLLKDSAPNHPDAWARLVAQHLLIDEDQPQSNLALIYSADGTEMRLEKDKNTTLESLQPRGEPKGNLQFIDSFTAADALHFVGVNFLFMPGLNLVEITAKNMVRKLRVNCREVYRGRHCIGVGLYLILSSSVSHSCNPNCSVAFEGKELVLYSLTPGEMSLCSGQNTVKNFTISNDMGLDIFEPKEKRQKILKQKYSVDCECAACCDLNREAEMITLYCATCGTGLAKPVDPANFSPFDSNGFLLPSAKAQATEIKFQCCDPRCGASFNLACYNKDLVKLEKLQKTFSLVMSYYKQHFAGTVHDGIIAAIKMVHILLNELKQSLLPEFSVARYRLTNRIASTTPALEMFVSYLKSSYVDNIKFLHHYLRPGHGTATMEYSKMAGLYITTAERMKHMRKDDVWFDAQFQRCVTEGLSWCKDHMAIVESVYGPGHPDANGLKEAVFKFSKDEETLVQKLKSGKTQGSKIAK